MWDAQKNTSPELASGLTFYQKGERGRILGGSIF